MAIYKISDGALKPATPTTFAAAGISERNHLQQLLKHQVEVIAPDTLVIAEEFGNWEDSRRRIDLLAIDRDANLVVIELKRTEDGGHLELQALRYAAMVSTMTFDNAASVFAEYLEDIESGLDARARILEFLEWSEPDEDRFAQDVRIVLASAEFSKEITTSVLWLNGRGIDIRCIRMRPYRDGAEVLVDIQQVIPLPEAEEYQVRIRDKVRLERSARTQNRDFTKYDVTAGKSIYGQLPKRRAILQVIRGLCAAGISPDEISALVHWRSDTFRIAEGRLGSEEFDAWFGKTLAAEGRIVETRRYFTGDDELIYANGRTYALTKMWALRTTEAMDVMLSKYSNRGVSYRVASE